MVELQKEKKDKINENVSKIKQKTNKKTKDSRKMFKEEPNMDINASEIQQKISIELKDYENDESCKKIKTDGSTSENEQDNSMIVESYCVDLLNGLKLSEETAEKEKAKTVKSETSKKVSFNKVVKVVVYNKIDDDSSES